MTVTSSFAARVAELEALLPRWLPTAEVPDGTLVYGPAFAALVMSDYGALPPPQIMNPKLRERYAVYGVFWLVSYAVPPVPALPSAKPTRTPGHIGPDHSVVLPPRVLKALQIQAGDHLYFQQAPEGFLLVTEKVMQDFLDAVDAPDQPEQPEEAT